MHRISPEEPPPLPLSSSMKRIVDCDGGSSAQSYASSDTYDLKFKSKIFPSTRFFMALLLCLCFISLAITTSNISVALVCMVNKKPDDPPTINQTKLLQADGIVRRLRRGIMNDTDWDEVHQLLFENETNANETHVISQMTKCAMARFR
jgi:hypothetical protein